MNVGSTTPITDLLFNESGSYVVGTVGSPSNTSEITIDIRQGSEQERILGQLVYLGQPQESNQLVVLGQISDVETRNRWHEDLTFRGIIKRRGNLPHLSGRADVRTAKLSVQACFEVSDYGKSQRVSESTLGMSPPTGADVYRVRNEVLDALLQKYSSEIIYFGHAYGTDVKMPFWLKHFGRGEGGAGEAYHIGVFGKTGSGKSGLAAYLLVGYARHQDMGIIFIDPQKQFTSNTDLPFDLHATLERLGRSVQKYRLTDQIRLGTQTNAVKLFLILLRKTALLRTIGVRAPENQEYASEELNTIIRNILDEKPAELDTPPPNFLEDVLKNLRGNTAALERIYGTPQPRKRLEQTLDRILGDTVELNRIEDEIWQPVLDLFMKTDSQGNQRTSLWYIIIQAITQKPKPIVFLDIQGAGTTFADDEEVKALILREISYALRVQGEKAFADDQRLNCLIALDEAHRYMTSSSTTGDGSEMANLTRTFVDGVRTTRKYGLGYMFITQTLASLHKEIIQQLRLYAFGYGLTSGSEYRQLEELVSDKQALNLYKSFVDPQSNRQYPFMFTGPISPLSFTGSPLFIQVFTDYNQFRSANTFIP